MDANGALQPADALVRAGRPLVVETFAEWREAARELLVHGIPPEQVTWSAPHMDDLLTGTDPVSGAPPTAEARAESGRRAIRAATATSATPTSAERPSTLRTE